MASERLILTLALIGGTGPEGRGLAYRWARAGYNIILGSRSLERAEAAARELNERLFPLHRALFADASPAPTKYALSRLHDWIRPETRLPIAPCSEAAKKAVDAAMEAAGLA